MGPIRVPHSAPHSVGIGVRADSGSGNNNNGSLAVSPPLVVVVIAIGLFSLTMFSMFGRRLLELGGRSPAAAAAADERRVWLSQALGLGHDGRLRREHTHQPPTAKPILWDIQVDNYPFHAAAAAEQQHVPLGWDDIMPLAVTVSEEEQNSIVNGVGGTTPHDSDTRRPTDRRACRLFRWLCLFRRRHRPTQTNQAVRDEQRHGVDKKAAVSPAARKHLQVVVAIAMPCRPRQEAYMESRRTHGVDIGLCTCSWQ